MFGLFWKGKKGAAQAPTKPQVPPNPPVRGKAKPPAPAQAPPLYLFHLPLDGSAIADVVPGLTRPETVVDGNGKRVLLLRDGDPAASPTGRITGFSVRVPDALEAAASGKRVRVSVTARAAVGQGVANFQLAYSTCDVGNSGWRPFAAGPQFKEYGFEWNVPVMDKGNGDYAGILPAPAGEIGVEVLDLTVEVLERGVGE